MTTPRGASVGVRGAGAIAALAQQPAEVEGPVGVTAIVGACVGLGRRGERVALLQQHSEPQRPFGAAQ